MDLKKLGYNIQHGVCRLYDDDTYLFVGYDAN